MTPEMERTKDLLDQLTDEQRLELFDMFCKECGSEDTDCQCWNDE